MLASLSSRPDALVGSNSRGQLLSRLVSMGSIKSSLSERYEHDYHAWIQDQVRALRGRRIEDLDWENLAEEIEDLGKSERRSLQSHLETLLEHLLKLSLAQGSTRSRNVRLWHGTIELARFRLRDLLDENPSLRPRLEELFAKSYKPARIKARIALKLQPKAIPEAPPWTVQQVIDDGFLPNAE